MLRMRAKTVRTTYKRHWECIANLKPRKFEWESPEGNGDAASRQEALLSYIEAHMPPIDSTATRICLRETATERWTRANRSGGDRHRAWLKLNESIAVELLRRKGELEQTARPDGQDSAQAKDNPHAPKYLLQLAVDVERVERDCLGMDLGVRKPTVKDRLKAAIANNYAVNNLAHAKLRQDQMDLKLALERVKRIKEYRLRMDSRPRDFDPNSDNEESRY